MNGSVWIDGLTANTDGPAPNPPPTAESVTPANALLILVPAAKASASMVIVEAVADEAPPRAITVAAKAADRASRCAMGPPCSYGRRNYASTLESALDLSRLLAAG